MESNQSEESKCRINGKVNNGYPLSLSAQLNPNIAKLISVCNMTFHIGTIEFIMKCKSVILEYVNIIIIPKIMAPFFYWRKK